MTKIFTSTPLRLPFLPALQKTGVSVITSTMLLVQLLINNNVDAQVLIGLTNGGGANDVGAIIQYNTTGSTLAAIASFNQATTGAHPFGSLIQASNGKLYGMTRVGGSSGNGTLVEYNITANTLSKKADFTGTNGAQPWGSLIQASNGKLYGFTSIGGSEDLGTVVEYDINANTLAKKADFTPTTGANPYGSLIEASNGKLYGMTYAGGSQHLGTVVEYDINANTLTKKADFNYTNGAYPNGSLIQASNGKLYGFTRDGGSEYVGTVVEYDINSNTLTKKADFTGQNGSSPVGSLIQASNGKLYGMTVFGGSSGNGTVVEYDITANTLAKKADFDFATTGVPWGSLIQASNRKLYGMTNHGGSSNFGTVVEYDIIANTLTKKADFTGANGASPVYGNFIELNQPPVLTTSTGNSAFIEGTPVAIDAGITVTDADNANLASATVSITSGFQATQDVLQFTPQNGITGSYNAASGVLSLTGSATVAQYQTALQSVLYTNNSSAPNPANRTISFIANDGMHNSTAATKTVTITAVNDAPTLNAISNITINQTTPSGTVNLYVPISGITDGGDGGQTLTVTATSNNTALIPHPGVSYTSPNTAGTLSFASVADQSGTAIITVTVTDNGGTANGGVDVFRQQFSVTVTFFSQITHYFRTRQSGNWNDENTWESSPVASFSSGVVSPATLSPDHRADTILIRSGHTVTVNAEVSVDETVVDNGGAVNISSGNVNLVDGAGFDLIVNGAVNITSPYKLTIKSTSAGTASVGASSGTITGNVTVERFIPDDGHRAWRLLSVPVTGTQTIRDSWQEGGAAAGNLGTLITSNLYTSLNGFDLNSISPSILIHDQGGASGPSWTTLPVTNTNVTRLDARPGYMLFVRGNRSATPANNLHAATTLRSTGALRQGTQPAVPVSSIGSGYTLVGNPYASPIDFESIAGTPNLSQSFYIWDANLSGIHGVGGFRTVERTGPNTYQQTPQATGGTVSNNTIRYIHSGQAFFIKANAANASVVFTEASKAIQTASVNPFRPAKDQPQLLANLMIVATDKSVALADGIRVKFDEAYSQAVTSEDVIKMNNLSENLASQRDNKRLIVEKRPEVRGNDTIFLSMSNMAIKNYRFELSCTNLQAGLAAYLIDNFSKTKTAIDLTTFTNVDFSVTSESSSAAEDRFMIIFNSAGVLPAMVNSVKAYQQGNQVAVEWQVQNETGIKQYEVERSADGQTFATVTTTIAKGNNLSTVSYNWIDAHATNGSNFYRIRGVGLNGEIKYSEIIDVTFGKAELRFVVYPNPVRNNVINLKFINQQTGLYRVRLLNNLGQVMQNHQIPHTTGSTTNTIKLRNGIQKGQYVIEVTGPDNNKQGKKIIIN